ncbi:hypothetical protein JCGZ_11936 [Jatropha curcas]|uniref:Uncharacterized protein n=1 Tax=Jatropha curcas TaxID=180498 RepID=A0A067KQ87_JATCU|nr:hypothetical protein JCGZ_11936 [Jatropha curcas]
MALKKSKGSKLAKVVEAMKKKAVAESSGKRETPNPTAPLIPIRPLDIRGYFMQKYWFTRLSKLKSGYTEMEAKKNQMEDTLKDAEVSIREQELESKVGEMEGELQRF